MKWFFVLLLLIMCFTRVAIGMDDLSLYSASVPVLSQSIDERTEAAKEGLKQVLIKLTGTSTVIDDHPTIYRELQRAAYYLQDFDYKIASLTASQHTLNLHFNPTDINTLLAREHIPLWKGKRPSVLVWLTYKGSGIDEIISYDSVQEVLPQLTNEAAERGLPLVLPFMDTQELSYLGDGTPSERSFATFVMLSKRYDYDALLIATIEKQEKGWQGKWTLISNQKIIEWSLNNQDVNYLIASMLNDVTRYFFAKVHNQSVTQGART